MKKVFYILIVCTLALPMVSCGKKSSKTSTSYTSQYKSFRGAVDDGSVYPGMTLEEIEKICGKASDVSYEQGSVRIAYYGAYQLSFLNGRYQYWNKW